MTTRALDENTLLAASASVDITPTAPVTLGAAGAGIHIAAPGEERLEANLLAITSKAHNRTLVICTLDLLYPGAVLREQILKRIDATFACEIVLAASHTHRGPMTDTSKPLLGGPNHAYIENIAEKIAVQINEMITPNRYRSSILKVGEVAAHHSINRRLFRRVTINRRLSFMKYQIAPNPDGATDELVTAATVEAYDGRLLAIIWNYACHPVGYPSKNVISTHYPGTVREDLRAEFGSDLPVLFLQGFSGNTRPNATATAGNQLHRLRRMLTGPHFAPMSNNDYQDWTRSLATRVKDAISASVAYGNTPLTLNRHTEPSYNYLLGRPGTEVAFSTIQLGTALTILTINGEVMAEYAQHVRDLAPTKHVMPTGCVDDVIGYLPTRQIVTEGGYEGGGFCKEFNLLGINPSIEDFMNRAIALALGAKQ